jgi:hypothetical protein
LLTAVHRRRFIQVELLPWLTPLHPRRFIFRRRLNEARSPTAVFGPVLRRGLLRPVFDVGAQSCCALVETFRCRHSAASLRRGFTPLVAGAQAEFPEMMSAANKGAASLRPYSCSLFSPFK